MTKEQLDEFTTLVLADLNTPIGRKLSEETREGYLLGVMDLKLLILRKLNLV